jgi:phage tail-like protein
MTDVELPGVYLDDITEYSGATRLLLINREPENLDTGVPADTDIALVITDTGSSSPVLLASVQIYVDSFLAVLGSTFNSPFNGTNSGTWLVGTNARRYILDKTTDYGSEATVTVRVLATTLDAAESMDVTYTFTIEDTAAPTVTVAQASDIDKVRVQFSEAVKQTSASEANDALNPANYSVTPSEFPAITPTIESVSTVSSTTVELTLGAPLSFGKLHTVQVSNVVDLSDNVLGSPDQATFYSAAPAVPVGRSFQLWDMLPGKHRRDDETGDLLKFILCLQDVVDLLLYDIDRYSDILDPDFAPDQYLDAMLADFGNPFEFDLDVIDKRRLLRVLVLMYRQKGTERGIKNVVRFFLGFECDVVPWTEDMWILGESELGDDTVLAPSAQWQLYAFDVDVTALGRVLADTERSWLTDLVNYMKPAHTHFVNILEYSVPVLPDHLELGVSRLGENWELH